MKEFYLRKEFREFLVKVSKDREIGIKFGDKGFGKRPQVMNFPGDVVEAVRQGATSFHLSEERWSDPMQLSPDMTNKQKDDLRIGWDLLLDIDCKVWGYSKLTAHLLIEALKYHDIENISLKFSGNKGFHIGVCFESFPEELHGKTIKNFFPDGLRILAGYLSEFIKEHLRNKILEIDSEEKAAEKAGLQKEDVLVDGEFDPFKIVDIDTILISSRHLFRAPYSLHEKSNLVGIPIDISKINEFEKDQAKIENVKFNQEFLDRTKSKKGEATGLLIQALDWHANELKKKNQLEQDKEINKKREYHLPEDKIDIQFFPPCIRKGLEGMEDGRKRFVFTLINFLRNMSWDKESIQEELNAWNKRNHEPLRENYILAQLNWAMRQKEPVLPANCNNHNYYKDISLCQEDMFCKKIKNPVNYARFKHQNLTKNKKKTKKKQ